MSTIPRIEGIQDLEDLHKYLMEYYEAREKRLHVWEEDLERRELILAAVENQVAFALQRVAEMKSGQRRKLP